MTHHLQAVTPFTAHCPDDLVDGHPWDGQDWCETDTDADTISPGREHVVLVAGTVRVHQSEDQDYLNSDNLK